MAVRILGPFEVRAPGTADAVHHAELTTLLAMAAVNPTGVPAAVVRELLPEPGAVAAAASQLRDWLGVDASGHPYLSERDGHWRLSPEVGVDWQVFRELVSSPEPGSEPRRLAKALAMIRGELLAGVSLPPGAQRTLGPHLAELHAMVVHTVGRDMRLALGADDPARAEWALRQGLMLLPREEGLWRMRLGLQR